MTGKCLLPHANSEPGTESGGVVSMSVTFVAPSRRDWSPEGPRAREGKSAPHLDGPDADGAHLVNAADSLSVLVAPPG